MFRWFLKCENVWNNKRWGIRTKPWYTKLSNVRDGRREVDEEEQGM